MSVVVDVEDPADLLFCGLRLSAFVNPKSSEHDGLEVNQVLIPARRQTLSSSVDTAYLLAQLNTRSRCALQWSQTVCDQRTRKAPAEHSLSKTTVMVIIHSKAMCTHRPPASILSIVNSGSVCIHPE